jgi:hypothetical protein
MNQKQRQNKQAAFAQMNPHKHDYMLKKENTKKKIAGKVLRSTDSKGQRYVQLASGMIRKIK